jgi:hypothetical protein
MLDGWYGAVESGACISVVPGFREPESGVLKIAEE